MKVGDIMKVTGRDLRVAPWRRAATWINEAGDAVTASDVIHAAGLDWEVTKAPLTATVLTESGVSVVEVPDKVATTRVNRDGSASVLGIVGDGYSIVQNMDIASLIDGVTYEAGAVYDSAGELKGGKRIYVAAKLPETVQIGGIDPCDTYLIATNSHDGTKSLEISIKHLRLKCLNGMRGWKNHSSIKLKHTLKMDGRVSQIREALDVIYVESQAFREFAVSMLHKPVSDNEFFSMTAAMFPVEADSSQRAVLEAQKKRDDVFAIWRGDTQDNIHGTAWGAWQAFVEYADWARATRGAEDAAFRRAERSMLEQDEAFKDRALALVV